MDKRTNKEGVPEWDGVKESTPLTSGMFSPVPMPAGYDRQVAFHSNLGSLTVLNRMTGFGYPDVETGYRCPEGKFWLASGGFDVRGLGEVTVREAIDWVKKNANTCIPKQDDQTNNSEG